MTSTSLDLSNRPELEPVSRLAAEVVNAGATLGIPPFMAGAMARDLILAHGYGVATGRRTEDMDWAMVVEGWAQFDALKHRLLATNRFAEGGSQHRLRHQTGWVVDLIPFGGVESRPGFIAWPRDHATVMRVLGFRDAFAHTMTVRLPSPVEIQVVSPAAVAMLKLFAWQDRHHEFPTKDAQDFALVARTYLEAGNRDRLFDQFISLVEAPEFDYQLAGARMLGHDIAEIAGEQAQAEMRAILAREADVAGNLALARAMGRNTEQNVEMIQNMLMGVNDRALNEETNG